jgi:hypothetical protein
MNEVVAGTPNSNITHVSIKLILMDVSNKKYTKNVDAYFSNGHWRIETQRIEN